MNIFRIVIAVFIPPLGVFLHEGIGSILEKYFANLTW
jgi:uncharacterized membrane protein YqaE (UPF0057 family)